MRYKLCRFCGQPMKPKSVRKKPGWFDHAQGCPYDRTPKRKCPFCRPGQACKYCFGTRVIIAERKGKK